MREHIKKQSALLVTDDPAVETTVRHVAQSMGNELQHLRTNRDALSGVLDAYANECFAIVDLDLRRGGRSLLRTAAGKMRVIAIGKEKTPWLSSMLQHRQIEATLSKPVSGFQLKEAFDRIGRLHGSDARFAN